MSLSSMRIPFQPLLKQITECLSFQVPAYGVLDSSKNNACVAVRPECGPIAYVYVGGEATTLDESCDRAAEKAVHDLISKYGVHVEDFTAGKKRMFDRCGHLYRLKRVELEGVEKGFPSGMPLEVEHLNASSSVWHTTLDYMSVLPMVVKHTQALLTPLESICFVGVKHTSWQTITCPHSAHGTTCIFGNACASLAESKQSVAKKAITFMMHTYNFSIIDANYKAADYTSILCALERESYLTTKERVLNIQEPIQPSPLVVDQDCLTPRGKQFQIPTMVSPPFPPKKRKARSSFGSVPSTSKNSAVPLLCIPSELETVMKRIKKDGC
ncbi:uncharacterized protein LOC125499595 [Beta vulgaris subsp. vulgaris]|uniref:uncharacterized protein LOC125499595 n=1 Tax=Beta vulgaris subsp. vulgaris TaxID=3555 RepID=UPI0025471FCE|nr:uncharacterized protein LOC125499595 [Beta vulgaris subsp. vulgaris]